MAEQPHSPATLTSDQWCAVEGRGKRKKLGMRYESEEGEAEGGRTKGDMGWKGKGV